jgi:3D-(3,5/4)-trihydroxycyclohexane-1,2-dione acylhydrolase (decyclizing)
MLDDCTAENGVDVHIDFAAHAAAMGADAVHVADVAALAAAMVRARAAARTQVIVIDTTHSRTTDDGGCWWEVGIPEVSQRAEVEAAAAAARIARQAQRP